MKRLTAVILAALLLVSLSACGGKENGGETKLKEPTEPVTEGQPQTEAVKPPAEITLEALMKADTTAEDQFGFEGAVGEEFYLGAYYGEDKILSLPSKYKDTPVTCVTSYIFGSDSPVAALRIPETVTSLDEFVGTGNTNLQIVVMEGVQHIGYAAFQSCTALHTVIMNDGVTDIDEYAFYGCENLKEIKIPDSVTSIHFSSFMNCGEGFTIRGTAGSYAETYAKENDINFVAE